MLAYSFDQTVQVGWEQGQAVFTLNCGHSVNITEAIVHEEEDLDAPSETEHDVASIKFVLAGLFEISMREGDSPPSEEEISAYCSSSGVFALYPFAREYLADTTRRLGLPPLTLPVKLVPVSEHEPIE